jgi:hypothetical protein
MPFFTLPLPPSDWTFRPVFDLRERFERRLDKDFNKSAPDNRSDLFSRWRAGVDFSYQKSVTGRVMYQYAHNLFWSPSLNGSLERSDLFLAYADVSLSDSKFRLGRQQLVLGSERLLGPSDWGNTSRSFDMVRWTKGNLDLFGGRLAVNSAPNHKAGVAGAFYKSSIGDTLFIYKHDERDADQDDIYTLDHNWKFSRGKWAGDVEGAVQFGRKGSQKLEAWAFGSKVNYQVDPKWRFYGELAAASGGSSGDTARTFDQIYASNHSRYGVMDMQGWRNMTGISLGANFKPTAKLSVSAEVHKFGLWSDDDAWYGDGGSRNGSFVDPTGGSGKDVGTEFNLFGTYSVDARTQVEGGLGVFEPGGFIRSFAGRGQEQVWGYLQFRIRF